MIITTKVLTQNGYKRTYHTNNGKEIRHITLTIAGKSYKQRDRALRNAIAKVWNVCRVYHLKNNIAEKTAEWVTT